MSLRRVPPNLLVGQGAVEFAFERGVPILPSDSLVSLAARERWGRWRKDLLAVEAARRRKAEAERLMADAQRAAPGPSEQIIREPSPESYTTQLAGTWNESQSYSPVPSVSGRTNGNADYTDILEWSHANAPQNVSTTTLLPTLAPAPGSGTYSHPQHATSFQPTVRLPLYSAYPGLPRYDNDGLSTHDLDETDDDTPSIDPEEWNQVREYPTLDAPNNVSPWSESSGSDDEAPLRSSQSHTIKGSPVLADNPESSFLSAAPDLSAVPSLEDDISDTVGAIAIDCHGHIAAGSSSGGIGMKHKGRAGPAALVGIGTHVIPIEPTDGSKTCVATVTSGTGEHMATTLAAGICATRIFSCEVKGKDGRVKIMDEEAAIKAFVERDFMGKLNVFDPISAFAQDEYRC